MPDHLSPLPGDPEALASSGLLVDALQKNHHREDGDRVRITSAEQFGDGLATRLFRLPLEGPPSVPDSVVAKFPVTGETRALLDGIGAYRREVVFYKTLAAAAPIRVPRCYVAEQDEETQDFVLVLEDLGHLARPDQLAGLTETEVLAVVDDLARFHAWSWDDTDRLGSYSESFWPMDSAAGRAVQGQFAQLFGLVWSARRSQFAELLTAESMLIGDQFERYMDFFIDNLATPRTIVHGELRAENLFFDGEQPVIFDFQVVSQECGVRELAYLISTSLNVDDADRLEERLLEQYWQRLHDSGVTDYPVDQARHQYRIATAYNLLWPVMASVRWEEATDRGRALLEAMLERAGAAISRQRAVDVLPELKGFPRSAPVQGPDPEQLSRAPAEHGREVLTTEMTADESNRHARH